MTKRGAVADYGVDAPGVMIGLMGGGLAGLVSGSAAAVLGWHWAVTLLGGLVAACALVPCGLGLAMGVYALVGKRRTREWILARHPWRGDEIVLDVGAGRGFMAVGAAKQAPRGQVIAVDNWRAGDLSGNGAQALIDNAQIEGVADRIHVVTADARKLEFADNSFDVVVSLLCIHNIEPEAERETALREIVRVLKPGGRALIADYTATASYARFFRSAGLSVQGPINGIGVALSLMALVEAEKPRRAPRDP